MEQQPLFPNDKELYPPDLIAKATNVATVMQCGGVWFANGKFGVTWKLVQAVVKPKQTMRGQCFINLSQEDREVLNKTSEEDDDGVQASGTVEIADSSSDDDDGEDEQDVAPVTPKKEVAATLAEIEPPPAPKKKVVRKKKVAEE